MNRDDPHTSATDFLRSIMHDPSIPLSFRVDAAIALLPFEHAQPRTKKGKRIIQPPSVVIKIPPLPSAAMLRAEERQRTNLTLIKGHG
jgi:hypothetical protein